MSAPVRGVQVRAEAVDLSLDQGEIVGLIGLRNGREDDAEPAHRLRPGRPGAIGSAGRRSRAGRAHWRAGGQCTGPSSARAPLSRAARARTSRSPRFSRPRRRRGTAARPERKPEPVGVERTAGGKRPSCPTATSAGSSAAKALVSGSCRWDRQGRASTRRRSQRLVAAARSRRRHCSSRRSPPTRPQRRADHGSLRPHPRARPRPDARRGNAGGDPAELRRHRDRLPQKGATGWASDDRAAWS